MICYVVKKWVKSQVSAIKNQKKGGLKFCRSYSLSGLGLKSTNQTSGCKVQLFFGKLCITGYYLQERCPRPFSLKSLLVGFKNFKKSVQNLMSIGFSGNLLLSSSLLWRFLFKIIFGERYNFSISRLFGASSSFNCSVRANERKILLIC